jgi:hypothetical protein
VPHDELSAPTAGTAERTAGPDKVFKSARRPGLQHGSVPELQVLNMCWQLILPDVIEVRVRSDAEPTPWPFFCCAAVLSLSTCSSFALALCAKVLTSFMMSCSIAAVAKQSEQLRWNKAWLLLFLCASRSLCIKALHLLMYFCSN